MWDEGERSSTGNAVTGEGRYGDAGEIIDDRGEFVKIY